MNRTENRIRRDARVDSVSDERVFGDGVWVYLRRGLRWDTEGLHTIHESSWTAAAKELRTVKECYCKDCRPHCEACERATPSVITYSNGWTLCVPCRAAQKADTGE